MASSTLVADVPTTSDMAYTLSDMGTSSRWYHWLYPSGRRAVRFPAPPDVVEPRRVRPRLLFLCTGNSARSQIAEALVEHRSAGTVEARSAGSHPKPLHPNAVRATAERGCSTSPVEPRSR